MLFGKRYAEEMNSGPGQRLKECRARRAASRAERTPAASMAQSASRRLSIIDLADEASPHHAASKAALLSNFRFSLKARPGRLAACLTLLSASSIPASAV